MRALNHHYDGNRQRFIMDFVDAVQRLAPDDGSCGPLHVELEDGNIHTTTNFTEWAAYWKGTPEYTQFNTDEWRGLCRDWNDMTMFERYCVLEELHLARFSELPKGYSYPRIYV